MTAASFEVTPGAAAKRLDVYLATTLEQPRSQIQRLLKTGLVTVNGAPERPSYLVQAGDGVEVSEPTKVSTPATAPKLAIIYEDADILIIDKPAGLAVHPGAGAPNVATVADFARPRTTDPDAGRPGIVHRLDRDTSGLLVIAKHAAAKAYLQRAFKRHEVRKTYTLLTVGRLDPETAVIHLPVGRKPSNPLQQAVVPGGREAVTTYTTKAYFPGYTLVEAKPQTGRTHQLRVHFAALGHPVAGDTTYGPPHQPLGLKRQFLHAAALEFTAPSGETVSVKSPLPADLAKVLDRLEAGAPS